MTVDLVSVQAQPIDDKQLTYHGYRQVKVKTVTLAPNPGTED